jgi:hypothetical protein
MDPTSSVAPAARDMHLRYTDTNGKTSVREHRVWGAGDKFLAARAAEAAQLNADVKDKAAPRLAKVEVITPAEYRKERA